MPAENPLLAGKWSVKTAIKRLEGTVINDILPELWFFTSVAVMVSCVNHYTDTNLQISNQMLTVLGTVLGLVISFRTTSAYDRFWEGRKLWGTIALTSRNLAQIIWIHVPIDRPPPKGPDGKNLAPLPDARLRAILEKKSMVNLVQAFSVAVKHYLRSEGGIYYEDLYPLVSFLPQEVETGANSNPHRLPIWSEKPAPTLRRTASEPEKGVNSQSDGPSFHEVPPLRPSRNPPKNTAFDYFPPLLIFKPFVIGFKMIFKKKKVAGDEEAGVHDGQRNIFGKKRKVAPIDSNVPLEIVLFLSTYLQVIMKQALIGPPIATAYVNLLTSMQDAVTNLERIRTTPIPFAYQTHLRLSVWLYLFFLPFEIHSAFKFLTIPATAFATFLYLGFLEIGQEIENPFNYDANDLDLDYFCQQIRKELSEITAHPAPDPNTYIFSMWNQPLAPGDKRTAQEIIGDKDHEYHEDRGIDSVRGTLLKSWLEVSEDARQQRRFNLSGIQY